MTCAREGCNKPVPKIAVLHGDPYCSTSCFRADHGSKTAEQADEDHRRTRLARESMGMPSPRIRAKAPR